jgi:hypothetical protein
MYFIKRNINERDDDMMNTTTQSRFFDTLRKGMQGALPALVVSTIG